MDSKSRVFFQRTFSTVILLGLLVGAVSLDTFWGYASLIALLCNLTSYEWYKMQKDKLSCVNREVCLGINIIYPWLMAYLSAFLIEGEGGLLQNRLMLVGYMVAFFLLFTIGAFIKELLSMDAGRKSGKEAVSQIGLMLLAFVYPVWMFCFSFLFLLDESTIKPLLWLILVTKLSDIFAYVCGVTLGRKFIKRPFSPVVSPKKSWEGIIGSFILTSITASILASLLLNSAAVSIFALVIIFILSVTGDLAGSLIKRGIEVKDSGSLLPGIGGIFDLIDSPAFTVAAFSILLYCTTLFT